MRERFASSRRRLVAYCEREWQSAGCSGTNDTVSTIVVRLMSAEGSERTAAGSCAKVGVTFDLSRTQC